jgi:two-component system chemotaxis response regulator CheB
MRRRIRLAVVDDSLFVRSALKRMFQNDPRIHVVGCAPSGEDLLDHLAQWSPDVVTLDLNMPGIGGLATLDRIHEVLPALPVIVLSSAVGDGVATTIEALCRDQVDFIDKQELSLADFAGMRRVLLERIDALTTSRTASCLSVPRQDQPPPPEIAQVTLIVIGASTGGPPAIEAILQDLGSAPVPIVVAQHMPPGFTKAFAQRLNTNLPATVRQAQHGDALMPGTVLIAPGGHDLRLERIASSIVVALHPANTGSTTHPSVDLLFTSAAETCGAGAVGVLLSGMGADGAKGMDALRRAGSHTIAQDESTCVVYGMPRAAIAIGAACEISPLPVIGSHLRRLLHDHRAP